jgi:hypothetical protein
MKRNGSKFFFALMRKKCFFSLFRIDAKCRNLKRNENEMKGKNEKEVKTAIMFASKQNEAKWKQNFLLQCEKCVLSFFLASEAK